MGVTKENMAKYQVTLEFDLSGEGDEEVAFMLEYIVRNAVTDAFTDLIEPPSFEEFARTVLQ